MPTLNPYEIKTNGEQTTFVPADIPNTESIYHNTLVTNSVSRKPHHGENVVAESYLPPKLIIVKDNFPSVNSSAWTFGTTLLWEDLKSWLSVRLYEQYDVNNISPADIEIDKACVFTYIDNGKKYHCYVIVCEDGDLPNMYVSTETEHDNDLIVNNAKMLQTYRIAENVFLPIGVPGQDAGWYLTLNQGGHIRPSTTQFQIPNVTSVQVTNDYVDSDIGVITVDKFRNKSLLETDNFVPGMDIDEVFVRHNQLPSTIDKIFYCPRNSVYRYRAKGTKEETYIVNEIPTAQVLTRTLTLKKTMQPDTVVALGYNVFEGQNENYEIEYVDKEEIHVWYSGEILKITLGALPTQLLNGNQLRYYFEEASDEYVLDVINNDIVTSSTQLTLPATQEQVTLTIAVVFGCTLFRNISDIMSVETHTNPYQEFEVREEDGFIDYIYKKSSEPIVIGLGIEYFNYRGLMVLNEYTPQEIVAFVNDSGFAIDPRRRLAYRVTLPTEMVSLGETAIAKGRKFVEIPVDVSTVSFTITGEPLTLKKHNSEETQTFQEGTVSIHVDFFPFEYNNILYEIRRFQQDSEGYNIVNLEVLNGNVEFDENIVEHIKLVLGKEHVTVTIHVRTGGKLVVVGFKLDDDQTTGFLKLKINNSLMKYVVTRQLGDG